MMAQPYKRKRQTKMEKSAPRAPRHLESAKNFWSAAARRRFSAASTLKVARSTPKQRHRERANA
jgi:hypothetical protein